MRKFLTTLIKIIVFFIGWTIFAGLFPIPEFETAAVWRLFAELIPLVFIIGFTFIFWLIEKKRVKLHLINRLVKNFVLGSCIGIVWIGIPIVLLFVIGIIGKVSTNAVNMLWIWIISVFLNAIMQELLIRGYIYRIIKKDYNAIIATIVTTGIFTFLHGGAFEAGIIPVLNVISMSLFMTILLEYTDSLIAPIISHFIWNVFGGIIMGVISLADDYPSILNLELNGDTLLSGGVYKLEGSIIVLVMNAILSLVFLILTIKHKKKI